MNALLWILQVLLGLLFLFGGAYKLVMPMAELEKAANMPGLFLKFISVCEIAGGLGLILPGALRIKPGLTPLAAAGLVVIMIGAVVTTAMTGVVAGAAMPLIVGVLCAFVAYGRWRLAPHADRSRGRAFQGAR